MEWETRKRRRSIVDFESMNKFAKSERFYLSLNRDLAWIEEAKEIPSDEEHLWYIVVRTDEPLDDRYQGNFMPITKDTSPSQDEVLEAWFDGIPLENYEVAGQIYPDARLVKIEE